jgi:surfeit locus 1 family protein
VALAGMTVLAATVCASLGVWQGRRLTARRAANRVALAGRALPPLALGIGPDTGRIDQRRVVATGRFDHDRAIVLRDRSDRNAPGIHLVTPLLLDGTGKAVLVNRGFVPADDAMRPDSTLIARTGHLTVRGVAFRIPETRDSGGALQYQGRSTWRRLDLTTLRARFPYPILDVYIAETEPEARAQGEPLFPRPAPAPELDDGPHLFYMVQWFGLAAAALAFGMLFVWRGTGTTVNLGRDPGRTG